MNNEYKLDECQIQKQLQTFNSFITLHTIIKVSLFLKEYNLFLTEVIGCGEFGVVFKAYDDYNSRDVAIKIVNNQNPQKNKELEKEIKIIRKIKSEYVIKIYEHLYDEESSCFMIVMEYCQLGNLHSYFNNKKCLEKEEIIRLFTHFLVGLQDIHSQNIIHSDLKPQNILFAQNHKLKICDLGLSKIISNNQSFTSNKGVTFIYSSKEQQYGQVRLESDYYSAGAILCFLCDLEIESNMTMAGQLKDGIFPDINNKKYKEIIEIGFQMMQLDHQKRVQPKIVLERLNELKNNNNEIIRSQRESQTDKEIKNEKWIYFWNNGDKYEGEWKNDKMNGSGIYYWQSGERYEGEFKDDVKSGQATYYYQNGDKFVGQYQNDKKNGYGIKYFLNEQFEGDIYKGEWKDNSFSGQGTYYFSIGDKFVGKWENNNMNGYGVYYYADGERYEGELRDDLKHGQGTLYYADGNKYEGEWQDDLMSGQGTLYYADGDKYEGQWQDDLKSGLGCYYFSDIAKYVGNYLNDKQNGYGIKYFLSGEFEGDLYEGEWKDNNFSGQGTYYFSMGDKYDGKLENNDMNGYGVYYYSDGGRYEGEWRDDQRSGQGSFYYSNGDKYVGKFLNDLQNGEGTYYYKSGKQVSGFYKDGVKQKQ